MEEYFALLDRGATAAYTVASRARATGLDPQVTVEIPRAEDMAGRVEKLLAKWKVDGIAPHIRELAARMPREDVALTLAQEIAEDKSRGSVEERLDCALRVGLAILTEGILVAPLEGLAETHIKSDPAGAYVDLYYAGPIRAAGGTAQALSVLLADLVRRKLGLAAYKASPAEVARYKEEIPVYKHCQHLQYVPTPEEIELVVSHVPVCIDGEATEGKEEVSAFRDLPRVATNGIRGGACLVIAEGLCQKAAKLRKVVEHLGIPGWEFLKDLGKKSGPATSEGSSTPQYLAEAVGGRPVLAYPHRAGGFRLVYGRSRTTGLAAAAVNPATMVLLRHFVAVGTQVKTEFPGKAAAMALCDTVEGPIVLLEDGRLVQVHDASEAELLLPQVRRLVDLGEILVAFGEFLENNKALVPGAYSLAWHLEVLRAAGIPLGRSALAPSWGEALEVSQTRGVPLHPRFNLFWHDLSVAEVSDLSHRVETDGRWEGGRLSLPLDLELKETLVVLGALHDVAAEQILIDPRLSPSLLLGLGLAAEGSSILRRTPLDPAATSSLAEVSRLAGITIKARGPSRVGARVGRPEKARQRTMSPNVHVLFPVGEAGGPHRSFITAAKNLGATGVPIDLGVRICPACRARTVWARCSCGTHTTPTEETSDEALPVGELFTACVARLGLPHTPGVKGVKALMSEGKTPEPLEKGALRALHGVSVYQDGTARFDLTDLPLTHVRLREIGLSPERARAMGYTVDWSGRPLTSEEQLLELKPQDLVVSRSCGEYMLALSKFVDDELRLLYGLTPYYNARHPDDLVGALVIALAPHTSGGVLGRILGYTEAEGCFAHPVFHAAKRRNCDGDEDSVTLLLDGLLNFSHAYLPTTRGSLMDKPLVLTTRLDAREVDKEAHNVDLALTYPLGLYEAADKGLPAKDVAKLIETVGQRLEAGPDRQLGGYAFTHDTSDIAGGPVRSAYRDARGMETTVSDSLALASQIRAVDVTDAVSLVLNHHFLPDMMGNMKSYATQKFRCKACGASYRRPPLGGACSFEENGVRCGGDLLPTVYEAAVTKYLGLSQKLADDFGVSAYLRQRLDLLESSLTTLFPRIGPKQTALDRYHEGGSEPDAPPAS